MRRLLFSLGCLLVLGLPGCGNDHARKPTANDALTSCLDRPGTLARAPEGVLPCELIPPGLVLPAQ